MNERPILFSTEMVRAILDGRKIQTRRTIKQQPPEKSNLIGAQKHLETKQIGFYWSDGTSGDMQGFWPDNNKNLFCPYGQSGDILWVKEQYFAYGQWKREVNKLRFIDMTSWAPKENYKYSDNPPEKYLTDRSTVIHYYKRNSRFMPKAAARIYLLIEKVSVERLHDIKEKDVLAEGIIIPMHNKSVAWVVGKQNSAIDFMPELPLKIDMSAKEAIITAQKIFFAHFAEKWCEINSRESWDANPWVWVITFKVLSTTGKPEFLNQLREVTA